MALLQSLEIRGIRNFSPDEGHNIYFESPVVLFQGPNGSGKTTILESIRYALTGELPTGTTNGQGFINEPRMSNKSVTKANIKLKFFDAEGNTVTVSRVMQVQTAAKTGNLQFKRLDSTVRQRDKNNPDKYNDISGRCLDIDAYCCSALNVSKTIFNNVLFCHQENSLWPLDEPKKLKEKFDEIFDAVRYNKCVDEIRKFIKEKQTFGTALAEKLQAKKIIKLHVERQRTKLEETKNKLTEITEAIERKTDEMKPLEDRMKEILDLEESLGSLQGKLRGKQEEKKGLASQQATILNDISYIFEGTDEELDEKLNSFKDQQSSEEASIRKLERSVQEVIKQIESTNRDIQTKQVRIGQMKEEQNQYNKKLEESRELVEKLRSELDVEDFGDKEILLGELSNALRSQQKKFVDLKKEKEVEEKQLQDRIDKIREQNAATKQLISSKRLAINENNNKLKEIRYKLEELDTSDTQLKVVEDRIKNYQSTLTKLKNSFNETEKKQEIEELKEIITNKEQYLEKLDREYRVLQRNYATEQKLDSEKSLIIEKQGAINKIKNKHSQNLNTLFKDDVPDKNLRKSVLNIQNQQEVELRNITKSINNLERELTTLKTTLSHQNNKLKADQQELSSNKKKIVELCKGRPFLSALKDSYQEKEKLQKLKGHLTAASVMYDSFINKFQEKKCCPICSTDFKKNSTPIPTIIQELKSKVNSIPTKLNGVESDLMKEEKFYNELQQLKTVNDGVEMMTKNKIPELEKLIDNLKEQVDEKSMELAAEKTNLETPQKLMEICKNLISDATLIDSYQTDIIRAKMTIAELERNIETVPSKRSRQETEMEIDSVKGEISNSKNRYETNKNMLDQHRERCQDLNRKLQSEVQTQIDIQKLVQQKPLLEKQNEECIENISALEIDIEELKTTSTTQEKDLRNALENKRSVGENNRKMEDKFQKTLIANQNSLSDIHKLEKSIQAYERNNSGIKLKNSMDGLVELNVNLEQYEKKKSENLSSISSKKEAIAKKESEFRALKDNVTLRERRRQEELVAKEIREIERKIGGYNYRQVYEEKQRKTSEINKKRREIDGLNGQLEEIRRNHNDLEIELNKPENKRAFVNYKKQYYEVVINKLVIKDFMRFVNVLERSVLKFHEDRMILINITIRNLWRSIYRGNDIDYIEIKNDDRKGGNSNRRRIYTYRVVQVKNDIELDMRGRCSAGQKVLACLVIRMALAETFSAHCGILALDEPTTNLDKANISSLCDALCGLVSERTTDSSFQLLIITHDEEFLRSLTQNLSLSSYWQVRRTPSGNSAVERCML